MKHKLIPVYLFMVALLMSCGTSEKYVVDETYHGFKLIEKRFVKEVNAECLYFEHEKSGAQLMKVASDDENKTFNIAFNTVPEHDYGTPHIMEHSVLNGSKNFPVKSPFDVLTKGSLNTFINAMTGADITTYPVASMNDKDYFNLMYVYLDAVFNPLIYSDPRILKQEGWHHEMSDVDGDVVYKGVVYNEMKGAFSDPTRELGYQQNKTLFPDNTYGVSSGGYPSAIPQLTYEHFINFHKKFYHPSNSHILLYGNADLDKELEFIDSKYLSTYERSTEKVETPLQKPFAEMKELEKTYPVSEGMDTNDKTFLSLSFVAGQGTDLSLVYVLDGVTDALVNHESAPIRLALQEAGIGRNVRASLSPGFQNVFEIRVQNANPEDKDRFKEICFETMKKVVEEGFDKTMLEGILNRAEFSLREGDNEQKGLQAAFSSYLNWFFDKDPFAGLEYEKPLAEMKKALNSDLFEQIVQKQLISNPHALLLVMKPEPGLQNKLNQATLKELAEFKASLTLEQKEALVKETEELIAYQKEQDSPEDLATIPSLALSDISPKVEWYDVKQKNLGEVPILHVDEFTSHILYANLYFDMQVLPVELIPYAKMLSAVLGRLSTDNYTFGELDNALNIHTGGSYVSINSYLKDDNDDQLQAKFTLTSKGTVDKADKMFELAAEMINNSKLDDKDRLKALLTRHQVGIESFVKNRGINVALNRASSYYSNSGMFNDLTSGLAYYKFITAQVKDFDANSDEIISKLKETASMLFNQSNYIASVTCHEDDYDAFTTGLESFNLTLADKKVEQVAWEFEKEAKNEGLQTVSKVQYVVKAGNFKAAGYEYSGKMKVLNQILSRDWLQTQIRVIGGAYGGFCGFSPSGNVYFASYRDPNLKESLENYDATPGFLESFEADESEMTRFIIGTIANMDGPKTPSQRGTTAISRYFSNKTLEEAQAEREAVLSTTAEDVKAFKNMVEDVLAQNNICVYGNDEKIKENKDIFGALVKVTE